MKYLLTGVAALSLVTACGQKHNTISDPTPAGINFLEIKQPTIVVQKGDPATAESALSALSLNRSESGRIKFSSKKINGATAVFKGVEIALPKSSGDGEFDQPGLNLDIDPKTNGLFLINGETLKAETMTLEGLALRDGKPAFGRLVLAGVTFATQDRVSDEDAEYSGSTPGVIKTSGRVGAIDLVNPSPELAAWVSSLFGKGAPAELPEGAAFAFDRWAVDDLRVTSAEPDSDSVFLVEGVEVAGLNKERAAVVTINKLSLEATDKAGKETVDIALGKFDLRGSKITTLALQPADSGRAEEAMMDVFALSGNDPIDPGFESFSIANFKFNVEGAALDLPKLEARVGRDKAGQAVKFVTDPWTMTLSTEGEGAGSEELAGQLSLLGFEKVALSGQGDQVYDPKTDMLTMVKGKNFFEVEDGFRLDFYARYEGTASMTRDRENLSLTQLDTLMGAMRLHGAEISLKDYGLVDRSLNLLATQEGKDPLQYRKDIKDTLDKMTGMALITGGDAALFAEFSGAVGSFVQKPKTLTLRFNPKEPVALAKLIDEDGPKGVTKKALGFSAENR